ncbi:hypothetical protein IGI04_003245 [Brassica rapa subsp. trilocularis]|uniref:Uncharacterized protein n=1 Tax=Brassica rapa subsp. trilocularis TaxID=1813537 RepID=A0ABQ7NXW1_BRACM|nr:hypothetical protein IGI04_003245 [Brassica rapa subsp. trilocularis]
MFKWKNEFRTDRIIKMLQKGEYSSMPKFKELVNIIMHYHQGNHGIYEDGRPIYIECLGQVIPVSYGYYNVYMLHKVL